MPNKMTCPLCGAEALLSFPNHWGFQAPKQYDIYKCDNCETSFSNPLAVDIEIYDLIYRNAEKVPGYDRYDRYRDLLKSSSEPLAELSRIEDVYWAIADSINRLAAVQSGSLRI